MRAPQCLFYCVSWTARNFKNSQICACCSLMPLLVRSVVPFGSSITISGNLFHASANFISINPIAKIHHSTFQCQKARATPSWKVIPRNHAVEILAIPGEVLKELHEAKPLLRPREIGCSTRDGTFIKLIDVLYCLCASPFASLVFCATIIAAEPSFCHRLSVSTDECLVPNASAKGVRLPVCQGAVRARRNDMGDNPEFGTVP
jgi:hypothetical protein